MRTARGVSIVLLLVFALPVVTSQGAQGEARITDPANDIAVNSIGQTQTAGAGYDDIDLREAWIGEETTNQTAMGFRVTSLTAVPQGPRHTVSTPSYFVEFVRADVRYRLVYSQFQPCAKDGLRLETTPTTPGLAWNYVACLPAAINVASNTIQVNLDKNLLIDSNGTVPLAGDALTGLVVRTEESYNQANATDRLPDKDTGPPFVFQKGPSGSSPLQLSSSSQVRFSNGESTTLVYPITLHNRANKAHSFLLSTTNLPTDWETRQPVAVPADAAKAIQFPVILTLPFAHTHGATETFTLHAEATDDASLSADLPLGVYFPEIPQPTGHHPAMYLHSRPPPQENPVQSGFYEDRFLWFNAIEKDPDPAATDGPASQQTVASENGANGVRYVYKWQYLLEPTLRLGLDFDTSRNLTLTTKFGSPTPVQNVRLEARLVWCDPTGKGGLDRGAFGCPRGAWTLLGQQIKDVPSLAANSPQPVEFQFAINASVATLPRKEGANLRLELVLSVPYGNGAGPAQPFYQYPKGSELMLPLFEYHEPVDKVFESIGVLKMRPNSPTEQKANPGRTAVFQYTIANTGTGSRRIDLQVAGIHKEWAAWTGPPTVSLDAHQEASATLRLTVPDGAGDGEHAELFAIAQDAHDPLVVAASRLRLTVTTQTSIPDGETQGPAQNHGTPSPTAGTVALGLLAVAGAFARFGPRREP